MISSCISYIQLCTHSTFTLPIPVQIPSHRSFNQIQEEEGVALESSKGTLDVNKVASSSSANQLVPASSSVAQSTSLESATTQESNKQLQGRRPLPGS